MLFDNTLAGVKPVVEWTVPAQAWDRVSYEIAPVDVATTPAGGATPADKELMIAGGYSLYASGTATKDQEQKRFAWGFAIGTRYAECQSEQGVTEQSGVVVTNNTSLDVELTTHGPRRHAVLGAAEGVLVRVEQNLQIDAALLRLLERDDHVAIGKVKHRQA